MKKKTKGKDVKSGAVFTAEAFGMALTLFSFISVALMVFSKMLFGGEWFYTEFLYGAMGYFAFPLFVFLGVTGIFVVLGKKHGSGHVRQILLVTAAVFFIFCLAQSLTTPSASEGFSAYVKGSYTLGEKGLGGCSGGGALFAVVVYPVLAYIGPVAAYVIFPFLAVAALFLLYRISVMSAAKKKYGKSTHTEQEIIGIKEFPDPTFDFSAQPDGGSANRLYYGDVEDEIPQRNKRDKDRNITILYPGKLPAEQAKTAPAKTSGAVPSSSYQTATDDEMKRKVSRGDEGTDSFARRSSVSERRTAGSPVGRSDYSDGRTERDRRDSFTDRDRRDSFSDRGIPDRNARADYSDGRADRDRRDSFTDRDRRDSFTDRGIPDRNARADYSDGRADRDRRDSFTDRNAAGTGFPEKQPQRYGDSTGRDEASDFDRRPERTGREERTSSGFTESSVSDIPRRPRDPDRLDDERPEESIFDKKDDKQPDMIAGKEPEIKPSNVGKFDLGNTSSKEDDEKKEEEENKFYVGIPDMPLHYNYKRPPITLYDDHPKSYTIDEEKVEERKNIIEETLASFNIDARVVNIVKGPTITRFEISIPNGTSVNKLPPRLSDLSMRLAANIRIEAPIPGKNLAGIEVPNSKQEIVGMKELLLTDEFKNSPSDNISIVLGEDVVGNPMITDLAAMPHLLVAGTTGTGKSVFLNTMIMSLVSKYGPDELRMILVDPKQVEFTIFEKLPHMLVNKTITEAPLCIAILDWAINEMELRYKYLSSACAQKIDEYNKNINPLKQRKMPKIVIIIDELGDLFSIPQIKSELELRIQRITQKARAAGIYLVVATQRPDAKVITGVIKTNLPARVAFKVATDIDSRIILNSIGAESLLGKGDMIFKPSTSNMVRIQGAYVSRSEMIRVIDYIAANNKTYYDPTAQKYLDEKKASTMNGGVGASASFGDTGGGGDDGDSEKNNMLRNVKALKIVIINKQASISLLQRKMSLGYATAGKVIDWMEEKGYIGPFDGPKSREVLITMDKFEELYGSEFDV